MVARSKSVVQRMCAWDMIPQTQATLNMQRQINVHAPSAIVQTRSSQQSGGCRSQTNIVLLSIVLLLGNYLLLMRACSIKASKAAHLADCISLAFAHIICTPYDSTCCHEAAFFATESAMTRAVSELTNTWFACHVLCTSSMLPCSQQSHDYVDPEPLLHCHELHNSH